MRFSNFFAKAAVSSSAPPLPRGLIRQILLQHRVCIGSRVLDVGCGRGELVRFFDRLGLEAAGLEESAVAVEAAARSAPHLEFRQLAFGGTPDFLEQQFDLILVRSHSLLSDNLLSTSARRATAELLSCLRPGGSLVFLIPARYDTANRLKGHEPSCLRKHLACFSGEIVTAEFPAGERRLASLRLVFRRPARPRYRSISLCLPPTGVESGEWLSLSLRSASGPACCQWADRPVELSPALRAA